MASSSSGWLSYLSYGDAGWLDELLAGFVVTVELALVSVIFGLLGGLILATVRMSRVPGLGLSVQGIMVVVRGVPEFVIILLVFFTLPAFLNNIFRAFGSDVTVDVPKFAAAVTALSLIFSVYAAEVFRGAWQSVPPGQIEAAFSIGMSKWTVLFRIRLPQMWRFAIPGLGNLWMVLIKDTSLAAVIALDEVLRVAKIASESTRAPLTFYLVAGLMYLLLTGLSDLVRVKLERVSQRGISNTQN